MDLQLLEYHGLSLKGVVYGVPHLFLYIKTFAFVSCFKFQCLPPWQTLHNSGIQDGVQDGCHVFKSWYIMFDFIVLICLKNMLAND